MLISIPGGGIVDALNYQNINIADVTPITISAGPAVSITGVEGSQLVNQTVATFSLTWG